MRAKHLHNKKMLRILRNELPKGFAEEIQKRLPSGKSFCTTYIYRVLSPDNKAYNELIIDVAVQYVEELSLLRQQVEAKFKRVLAHTKH